MDPFANNDSVSMNAPMQEQDDGDDQPLMRSVMAMPQASDPFAFANSSQSVSSGFGSGSGFGSKADKLEEVGFWDTSISTGNQTAAGFPFVPNCSLPTCPMMVQQHSTFVSQEQPRAIFQRLKEALGHLDFDANEDKFSIKAITFRPARCVFKVSMYENKDGARVVEFQRRSGCSMAFNVVYNDVLRALAPVVNRLYASQTPFDPSRVRCSLPPMDINFSDDFSTSQQELEMALEAFCEMMEAKFFEVQREGVNGLSIWLRKEASRLNLQQQLRLVKLLQTLLVSLQQELARSAAVSISLLLEQAKGGVLNGFGDLLPNLIQVVQTPDSLENRDTKRHSSAALKSLSLFSQFKAQFHSFPDFKKDLELFSRSSDKILSTNSYEILAAVY